jgi:hypothetical protein
MHKYFVGYQAYYLHLKNEEFLKERGTKLNSDIEPLEYYNIMDDYRDIANKFKREMINKTLSMVLRVTLQVKNESKTLKSVSGPESLFDPAYTGNHIVIFENQLSSPH